MSSHRVSAVIGAMLVTVSVGAACSRGGTPVAQESTAESTQTSVAATTTTTAPSDDDQVRETVMAFQQAYNTQNWDAYLELMCPSWRAQYTGPVMDMTKKTRIDQGLTTMTVNSVQILGDEATANVDAQNELLGRKTLDLKLVREDGWRVCMPSGVR
ncbi:MAG: nuclear transport factor 2 family protein [Mycobacteriaceae bacterium]|nr:nuclear transport factor 2 family protein [Mycobacteriaceae bacterium]